MSTLCLGYYSGGNSGRQVVVGLLWCDVFPVSLLGINSSYSGRILADGMDLGPLLHFQKSPDLAATGVMAALQGNPDQDNYGAIKPPAVNCRMRSF